MYLLIIDMDKTDGRTLVDDMPGIRQGCDGFRLGLGGVVVTFDGDVPPTPDYVVKLMAVPDREAAVRAYNDWAWVDLARRVG